MKKNLFPIQVIISCNPFPKMSYLFFKKSKLLKMLFMVTESLLHYQNSI